MHIEYDQSRSINILYLNFHKAIGKVPHQRLMAKAWALGVKSMPAKRTVNWLANWHQRVVVNRETSSWTPVTSVHKGTQGFSTQPTSLYPLYKWIRFWHHHPYCKIADDANLGCNAALLSMTGSRILPMRLGVVFFNSANSPLLVPIFPQLIIFLNYQLIFLCERCLFI